MAEHTPASLLYKPRGQKVEWYTNIEPKRRGTTAAFFHIHIIEILDKFLGYARNISRIC
jgi:hypothetical protein